MLKTLDRYIEDRSERDDFSWSLWKRITHDRRFDALLVVSVICHLVFYAGIIWASYWAMKQVKPVRPPQTILVEVAKIDPSSAAGYEVRAKPEPFERADLNRLEYDPENTDDTHLVARSPNPTTEREDGGASPSAPRAGSQSGALSDAGAARAGGSSPLTTPTSKPAPLENLPRVDLPSSSQPSVLPVPSSVPTSPASSSVNLPQPPVPAGSKQGTGTETTQMGLERVRAHYEAYVRDKIRRINERDMPGELIKDILGKKASATFELTLRRGGFIQSLQLFDPSGYRTLDDVARKAIYNASPFEGYPQNVGETITLTVIVHFYPVW